MRHVAQSFSGLTTTVSASFATWSSTYSTPFSSQIALSSSLIGRDAFERSVSSRQKRSKPPPVPEIPTVTSVSALVPEALRRRGDVRADRARAVGADRPPPPESPSSPPQPAATDRRGRAQACEKSAQRHRSLPVRCRRESSGPPLPGGRRSGERSGEELENEALLRRETRSGSRGLRRARRAPRPCRPPA